MSIGRIDFMAVGRNRRASVRHYIDHLAPIYHALPTDRQGYLYINEVDYEHAHAAGITRVSNWIDAIADPDPADSDILTVTAQYSNAKQCHERLGRRRNVQAEHGTPQPYKGLPYTHGGVYSGEPDDRKELIEAGIIAKLMPGPLGMRLHNVANADTPAYPIGCPKLDPWHTGERPRPQNDEPVVAISFRWNCQGVPEQSGVWRRYMWILPQLAKTYKILGHSHPRLLDHLAPAFGRMGIEVVREFNEVLDRADVYVCDNSSTMFEWISTDRPIVVLNAPWYRRTVDHGGRFWEMADMGVQVDGPKDLIPGIELALEDAPEQAMRRREITREVFEVADGSAAQLAADALLEIDARYR